MKLIYHQPPLDYVYTCMKVRNALAKKDVQDSHQRTIQTNTKCRTNLPNAAFCLLGVLRDAETLKCTRFFLKIFSVLFLRRHFIRYYRPI